jgi:hypothetical protein
MKLLFDLISRVFECDQLTVPFLCYFVVARSIRMPCVKMGASAFISNVC